MKLHTRAPEEQYVTQPKMPGDRPATKEEVWTWVAHLYGGTFDVAKLKQLAQDKWAWSYVYFVNFDGWRKQPDWLPGDPVVADAVPPGPIPPDKANFVEVNRLWAIAQSQLERTAA